MVAGLASVADRPVVPQGLEASERKPPAGVLGQIERASTVTLSRQAHVLGTDAKTTIQWAWGAILHKWMELIPAKSLYHFLMKKR